jgi:diguanylate cyclase (GGDEF)-like protein
VLHIEGVAFLAERRRNSKGSSQQLWSSGKIFKRFRYISAALFALAFLLIITIMLVILSSNAAHSSLLSLSLLLQVLAIMLVLLLAFTVAVNMLSKQLIFMPLEQLISSLARLKENNKERIYGLERDDELGELSNTIQDLFTKANHDALTGIYNRRFMEDNLQTILKFLSRSGGLLSVLMIDIDYFKYYNDTYGHEKGDFCLKAVAQALVSSVARTSDFVARYGGEEFVAVLPNTDQAGARLMAQKILANVRKLSIPHASSIAAPYITVSVGATSCQVTHTQSWEEYVNLADEALYMSKQSGRDRYTYLDLAARVQRNS